MQNANSGSILTKVLISLVAAGAVALLVGRWVATREAHLVISEPAKAVDIATMQAEAERGEATAQFNLGSLYARGLAVTQSYTLAAKWYRLAADQGQAAAELALGELYEVGQGVKRDESEAAKWYHLAAEQGNPGAQYSLAALYVLGKGVTADAAEAIKWYRLAADQGDALAQFNLGMRYHEGRGIAAEPVQAYQWLSLAAAQGITDAAQARDALKGTMTRDQLAEGQRRASTFTPKKISAKTPSR